MSFLDRLGEYLRRVAQGRPDTPSHPVRVDPASARNALIRSLERLEQEHGARKYLPGRSPEELLKTWQRGDAVVRFAERMEQLLRESIGKDASDKDIEAWIELAIARKVGLNDALSSRIRTLEIERLAELAWSSAFGGYAKHVDVSAYVSAIRATRRVGDGQVLTPIGRVFLELTGRDAIRWLLHVEAAQSFGPADPWRISRQFASALIHDAPLSDHWVEDDHFPYAWATINRMEALELLFAREDHDFTRTLIAPLPMGRELFAEIAKQDESSMALLAGSLIADLTLSATDAVASSNAVSTAEVQVSAVAESTARHSRLVAHEIRNILVPVKTALGALYREVLLSEKPGEVIALRREGIDRGIDSVFRFVDQLVELSKIAAIPPEPFDLLSAIRDAVDAVEAETGRHIGQAGLPNMLPPVSGHRARTVMALTNVLRNGAQAAPSESPIIRIQAEAIEGASAVRISIEDNGPGVPEPMRRAIFNEGISLRGGSGLGLALVREVFEKEMKGLVACDASPLGGARFVMRIPTTGMERP